MTLPVSAAGRSGVIVASCIVVAGALASAAAMQRKPAADTKLAAADATAPIDLARLQVGADPVSMEQGRVYYVQLCLDCHGSRGDGRGEWAYRVTPRPANLTSPKTRARSDAQLFEFISEPQVGTPMIGWKKQLSESQRRQLVTYVRHLSTMAVSERRH